MFDLNETPSMADRGGENITSHTEALRDILYTAWKYDDKPHQLYLAVARVAQLFMKDGDTKQEIMRLMDEAAGL
jgi:hypothetical protein